MAFPVASPISVLRAMAPSGVLLTCTFPYALYVNRKGKSGLSSIISVLAIVLALVLVAIPKNGISDH